MYLLVCWCFSVALAFFLNSNTFSYGGAVGELAEQWLENWIGKIGTAALLGLAVLSYIIWRFNPVFKIPKITGAPKKNTEEDIDHKEEAFETYEDKNTIQSVPFFVKGNDVIKEHSDEPVTNNKLKNDGKGVVVIMPKTAEEEINPMHDFSLSEKNAEPEKIIVQETSVQLPVKNIPVKKPGNQQPINMELEIKELHEDIEETDDKPIIETEPELVSYKPQKDYEPTLDLKDYKYPSIDLLEAHGSEKIVQDPAELEANKNQIIATLKNYDIAIQRIAATVGPTVTLYEIVPAPGVRISRIKNLEDDIALSLAALGIRIIAPIPGKGTIGIEVPNVRKTVVSMKTLLASDKFQNNNFSLPIAIGKKIDNENFIVDLASMPHLLMAGATGQGKSVGINALLVSLLYKKHPSQLKVSIG